MPALMRPQGLHQNIHKGAIMFETRSPYINPLVKAAQFAPADRQRTSFTIKSKYARKRAATWAKNNPTRFINAIERYGVVIVNCWTRSLPVC